MGRFAPILPELILSIGGVILMMVAAFTGRRGTALVNWLAIAPQVDTWYVPTRLRNSPTKPLVPGRPTLAIANSMNSKA